MLNSKEFGKRISSLRKSAKITQKELAKRCFVSVQAISKWENGISSPNILMLDDIAVALGVEINDLHSLVLEHRDEYLKEDKVHLNEKGIDAAAKQVVESIKKALN